MIQSNQVKFRLMKIRISITNSNNNGFHSEVIKLQSENSEVL